MSQHSDQIASLYKNGAESEFGKHLLSWIDDVIKAKRENAGKLEPVQAWGELKFADGLESVKTHISQMSALTDIK